ncbi:PGG domain [Dillenia turbinata]|uniref:PGG domain n=1 Tax=Dillenia turbinata TaxID=194707 RepID=A0AAN8UCA7_9MAGN
MQSKLQEAILKGDVSAFLKLFEEDKDIIKQVAPGSLNTVLHLAARFGHVELVSQIMNLSPEMALAENEKMETPLHEACREGHEKIAKILVNNDPWVAYKVNRNGETALFVASERGKLHEVKLLLKYQWMLMLELDRATTSLHAAASAGHTDVVKEILKARPDFARKKDYQGCTPLHLACSKGHYDITGELLRLDEDLVCVQDNEGKTPLHWAAIKGRINIIDEILAVSLESGEILTKQGETVLHLAVKNNQFEALRYLMETLNITKLVNLQDNDGNTILHLATAGKLTTFWKEKWEQNSFFLLSPLEELMVIYILKFAINVNAINRKGYTALDVVESDASNSGALAILPALQEAGAKRCNQLPPTFLEIQQITVPTPERFCQPFPLMPISPPKKNAESPAQFQHRWHRKRREKQLELHSEGLRNARNTITVVAVLIATVTFAAGINPPGGFNQQTGKAIMGRHTSFKVFMLCNIVALFLSLGIVIVLVSIIPFEKDSMKKLLVFTHKVMWASVFFMASAYVAAIWTFMPQHGTRWVLSTLISIGGGCTLTMFVCLSVMLANHWVRKQEWKMKNKKDGSPHSSISRVEDMRITKRGSHCTSSNSDVDSSDRGCYPV